MSTTSVVSRGSATSLRSACSMGVMPEPAQSMLMRRAPKGYCRFTFGGTCLKPTWLGLGLGLGLGSWSWSWLGLGSWSWSWLGLGVRVRG